MAGVFEKDQASPGNAFCNQFAVACGHEAVILAVDHKRWRTEARKAAISFKRHDARDLGKVGFGFREGPPADFEVLIYSLSRSGFIVDVRNHRPDAFLWCH